MNVNPIHHTVTNRIPDTEGGGWEFWCTDCSYRVRYTNSSSSHRQRLQIVDLGDPDARHTSNQMEATLDDWGSLIDPQDSHYYPEQASREVRAPDDLIPLEEEFNEQAWLTPEIRDFLSQITARLDP